MSKTKDLKVVKISRKRWCRGGRAENGAALRTESGQSCCLGFVARAYGLKTPVGVGVFSDLAQDGQDCSALPKPLRPQKNEFSHYTDTKLHNDLTATNDDSEIKAEEREQKIARLLAKAGVKALFVD